MTFLKVTRYRVFALIACAVLPTFSLFLGLQMNLFNYFSFPSFSSAIGNGTSSILPSYSNSSLDATQFSNDTDNITNNNATYPRLHFQQPHSLYATRAKVLLERVQSRRNLLFDGALKDLNDEMIDRLITRLIRAESDENYVPPKVRNRSLCHVFNLLRGSCTGYLDQLALGPVCYRGLHDRRGAMDSTTCLLSVLLIELY